jgi:SAM-dependent MidA family methyltransferase
VKKKIFSRIEAGGPLPFDEFMEMCLYDPEAGFFSGGRVRSGEEADFVTSPEVSPWFGRLLGRWAAQVADDDTVLVEAGAGSGALLEPLFDESGGSFREVYAVEISPHAREEISVRVDGVGSVCAWEDVPGGGSAVVIANELLDNIPFRLADRVDDDWVEYRIGAIDGTLTMEHRRDDDLTAWCDRELGNVPAGALLAAQIEAARWVTEVIGRFDTIRLCIIDYAATTSDLARRPRSDVVRTYHGHRTGFDFLGEPGTTDITTDVNVDTMVRAARDAGAAVTTTDQRSFLLDLGAGEVLEMLIEREHERARAGDTMGQLMARSEATNLRALLDREGLGGFTVFRITTGT